MNLKVSAITFCGVFISVALVFWIYVVPHSAEVPPWSTALPGLNAFFNSCSVVCILLGYRAIKHDKKSTHIRWMLSALGFSALFLISYLTYHHFHGNVHFQGTGILKVVYFFILISHIVLSGVNLPMVLLTFYFGISGHFQAHRRLARWTLPLWLYVSTTGVLVFILLKLGQA